MRVCAITAEHEAVQPARLFDHVRGLGPSACQLAQQGDSARSEGRRIERFDGRPVALDQWASRRHSHVAIHSTARFAPPAREAEGIAKARLLVHRMAGRRRIEHRRAVFVAQRVDRVAQQHPGVAAALEWRQHEHHADPREVGAVRQHDGRCGERVDAVRTRRMNAPPAPQPKHGAPVVRILVPLRRRRQRERAGQVGLAQRHDGCGVVARLSICHPGSRSGSACSGSARRAGPSRRPSRSCFRSAHAAHRRGAALRSYRSATRSALRCR